MSDPKLDRREMTLIQKLSIPEDSDPPWSLTTTLITVFVLFISLIMIGPSLSSIVLGLGDTITPFMLLLGWAIGQTVTILFVLINRRSSHESWTALKLQKGYLPFPLLLMLGVATALSVDLIISLASSQFLPIPEIFGFQTEGIAGILSAGLFLMLLQPIAETLVFQGVLLPKLRVIAGPWGGIAITTLIFTVLHYAVFYASYQANYPESTMLWYGIAYPLLAGFIFCLIKVYTNSTSAVIFVRVGAGLIFLLTALILVTG